MSIKNIGLYLVTTLQKKKDKKKQRDGRSREINSLKTMNT